MPFSTTTHLTSPSVLFLCLFEKQLTTNGRHFGSQQYTAHVSNSEVCSKTGQPTITTLIKQRGQCGHVARADQLKITTVHCEHLSTHLVTVDGRGETLVRPGYELSATILNMSTVGLDLKTLVSRSYFQHPGVKVLVLISRPWCQGLGFNTLV